ncbi:hypothetical protein [Dawidia soli]|uniref:Uncharacterized protein n=1 Tax=Dawidia soli TaxID=2782352 RepID=A0AAP2D6B5_9BACT|nr:hypothetical protein [Dawidia soli]MBT1686188.1 hypothetical protein [Dawidia soli]
MKTIIKQTFQNELQRFENIILKDLADFFKQTPELEPEFLPDFSMAIAEEVQDVKDRLSLSYLVFDSTKLPLHIQYHQRTLYTLAGHLLRYTTPAQLVDIQLQDDPQTFCQILYHAIEDLLDFIRTHFPQYFDQDVWIPIPYQRIVRHHVCPDLPTLRTALLHRGVTLDLIAIAMLPLSQFAGNKTPNRVTHRAVAYLCQLKARLMSLATSRVDNPNRQLVQVLCEINFNSPDFVAYCTAYMKHGPHNSQQFADGGPLMLYRFRKLLLQMQPAVDLALDPLSPPLQDTLCTWIDAELSYNEATQHAYDIPPSPGWASVIAKIIISLTGGQLSYLFSIMIRADIVKNKNKKELGGILATVFQTDTASDQGDSYRQQLYRVDIRTKKTIESILDKMLQLVRKDTANTSIR